MVLVHVIGQHEQFRTIKPLTVSYIREAAPAGSSESGLIGATWGLVIATALLVFAASIPLFRDASDRRERRRRISAGLVPDMNILRSRLAGGGRRLADVRSLTDSAVERQINLVHGELEMISEIIDKGERPSLLFVNETYLVRHLLTQAHNELERAQELTGKADANDIRTRDDALLRTRNLYKAALESLDSAERILPAKVRNIKGESFWDRFDRVARERESAAARSYVSTNNS